MFATRKEVMRVLNEAGLSIRQMLVLCEIMSKRLDLAKERIATLKAKQNASGVFTDKLFKFVYKPATKTEQSYEIVKIGKEKK